MDPIILMTIAVGNAITSFISTKQRETQEKIIKEKQKGLKEEPLRLARNLYSLRMEEEKNAHEIILKKQKEINGKVIAEISKNTEQYIKWPLKIPPVCLRGTNSLLPSELRIEHPMPLYIMIAPGNDMHINSNLDVIEDYLEEYISRNFTDGIGNRIVFLRNCWRDSSEICDEITIRNIWYDIKDVPISIFYPIRTNSGIKFGMGFWNIIPVNIDNAGNVIYSTSFDHSINSSDINQAQIDLARAVTVLSDMYGWTHYRFPPKLMQLGMKHALPITALNLLEHYNAYVALIKDMILTGLLSPLDELDELLAFCTAVDIPINTDVYGGQVFNALNLFDSEEKSTFTYLPSSLQIKIWKYFDRNPQMVKKVDSKIFSTVFTDWLGQAIINEINQKIDKNKFRLNDTIFNQLIIPYETEILNFICNQKRNLLSTAHQLSTQMVDCRDWFRPKMIQEIKGYLHTTILPQLLRDLRSYIKTLYHKELHRIVGEISIEMSYSFVPQKSMDLVMKEFKMIYISNFTDSINKVDIIKFCNEDYLMILDFLDWVNGIAKKYIDYNFLLEDTVRVPSKDIGYTEEDHQFFQTLCDACKPVLKKYIRKIFNEDENEYTPSSVSSSESSTFFDTVVMSPSF